LQQKGSEKDEACRLYALFTKKHKHRRNDSKNTVN